VTKAERKSLTKPRKLGSLTDNNNRRSFRKASRDATIKVTDLDPIMFLSSQSFLTLKFQIKYNSLEIQEEQSPKAKPLKSLAR
jgi:hypothetical protein